MLVNKPMGNLEDMHSFGEVLGNNLQRHLNESYDDQSFTSLLFVHWLKLLEQKDPDDEEMIKCVIDIIRYMVDTVEKLKYLKGTIAKLERITEEELNRLSSLHELEKITLFFSNEFDLDGDWYLTEKYSDEATDELVLEFEIYEQFFSQLGRFKDHLISMNVDTTTFGQKVEKIIKAISISKNKLEDHLQHNKDKLLVRNCFSALNSLITFHELAPIFIDYFENLESTKSPIDWSEYYVELDYIKDFDLSLVPDFELAFEE